MEKQWKCEHCGYIWQGETPPNHCPNCGHPKDEFTQNKFEDEAE